MCHGKEQGKNELQKMKNLEDMGNDTMGNKKEQHLKWRQWSSKGKKQVEKANIQ